MSPTKAAREGKPRISRRELLEKFGRLGRRVGTWVAAASLLTGLPSGTMRPPQTIARAWAQDRLEDYATAVQQYYKTHLSPEQALSLISRRNYEGLGGQQRYLNASTDLARLMATHPDWLSHEYWAHVFKLVQKPELIRQLEESLPFESYEMQFLKRAGVLAKKIAPDSEVVAFRGEESRAMQMRAAIKKFYFSNVGSTHLQKMGEITRQALEEYRQHHVFWDAIIQKYNWLDPYLVVDVMIARHFQQARDPDFLNVESKLSSVAKDNIKHVSIGRLRDAKSTERRVIINGVIDLSSASPRAAMDRYGTMQMNLNPNRPEGSIKDGVSTLAGTSPDAMLAGQMYFYRLLANTFLDENGGVRLDLVKREELKRVLKTKIEYMNYSIRMVKQDAELANTLIKLTQQGRPPRVGPNLNTFSNPIINRLLQEKGVAASQDILLEEKDRLGRLANQYGKRLLELENNERKVVP